MHLKPSLAFVLPVVLAFMSAGSLAASVSGRVVHIVADDMLDVLAGEQRMRIRLDAPESRQPYGSSRQSLIQVCASELAQVEISDKDRNRRAIGRVVCNGIDANAEHVRRGLAWVFDRYAQPDSPLYALQNEGRTARRGLWTEGGAIAPWKWRHHVRPKVP